MQRGLAVMAMTAAVAGCGKPAVRPGTGAEEVVREFYAALLRQDWSRAYAAVDAQQRSQCSADRFASLAQHYYRGIGFAARELHVRSCEEHGDDAIAHIVLTGEDGSRRRFHRDAITLRWDGAVWRVVLSSRFGLGP
jgi:hypothetical protein